MTLVNLVARLLELGFNPGDAQKDLGFPMEYYLYRKNGTQHQYLSLVVYEGRMVEAVFHVHAQPYNSRAKPCMVPLHASLYRSPEEVLEVVEKTY